MNKKVIRYTQEQTDTLVAAYRDAKTPEARKAVVVQYAAEFGKSTQSVISKLSRERVYIKPSLSVKSKVDNTSKGEYISHIAIMLGVRDISRLDSLEKCSKAALMLVSDSLNKMNDRDGVA